MLETVHSMLTLRLHSHRQDAVHQPAAATRSVGANHGTPHARDCCAPEVGKDAPVEQALQARARVQPAPRVRPQQHVHAAQLRAVAEQRSQAQAAHEATAAREQHRRAGVRAWHRQAPRLACAHNKGMGS